MAAEMGISLLTEESTTSFRLYWEFDLKTSSWLATACRHKTKRRCHIWRPPVWPGLYLSQRGRVLLRRSRLPGFSEGLDVVILAFGLAHSGGGLGLRQRQSDAVGAH